MTNQAVWVPLTCRWQLEYRGVLRCLSPSDLWLSGSVPGSSRIRPGFVRCPSRLQRDWVRPAWPTPVTNQVTTTPGKGSRNQTPSDIDIPVTFGYPTQRDATRRIDSPSHGDGQRTNPGHIRQPQGIEPDNHRPEGDKHLNTPRYCSGQRDVSGAQTAWLVT